MNQIKTNNQLFIFLLKSKLDIILHKLVLISLNLAVIKRCWKSIFYFPANSVVETSKNYYKKNSKNDYLIFYNTW